METESLIASPPQGFIVAQHVDGAHSKITEYVRKGEAMSNWSEMVTVQVLPDLKKTDPDNFAQSLKGPWLKGCEDSEVHEVSNRDEHGYPSSLWMFTCPLNMATGKPESMVVKIISGNDNLYAIEYKYRSALNSESAASAMDYFLGVRACDPRLADRPCPSAAP